MSDNIRIAERFMNQKAVYWAHVGDNESGEPEFDEPIEIRCRWDDLHEEFLDRNGATVISRARVMVDRDTPERGRLWLGVLEDLESESDPEANYGAYEIRNFSKVPNRQGTKFVRTAML
jgi:hypothetical protein